MSSSIQSSATASSGDVVLLSHPLNHVNHNHTDSPSISATKSFKRTRSPSLTRDEPPNESINETPTKKSRKKRTTTDIDHSLGANLSAEKLHVYRWPTDEPHVDLHVLQEQICEYLSLKSFKRKYPDIYRRIVDLHEREYLKSQNAVTETQCDLGLTALKLDEVLQLMSADYPEKCDQFNHVWQQKRRTLLAANHAIPNNNSSSSTAPILLSASISNHLSTSTNPTPTLADQADKQRPLKSSIVVRKDLLRSVADYNTQLQRERLEERKACFDLQTMQIHYPGHRQFRLPAKRTKIGSYPLALVPGQYQDSFKKYSSDELKYMPINTALYYYPKPLSLVHTDRFSQQAASSDEEEEGNSTKRAALVNPSSQIRPSTPQSPVIVNGSNGIASLLTRLPKPSTPLSMNSQSNICYMCKLADDEADEELMTCTSCQHHFHPICLDVNAEMLTIIKTYPWQCIDCKSCAKCNKAHDEANIMFCDRCDRGYHTYCAGLQGIPEGSWQCSACDPPAPSPPLSASPTPTGKAKRGRPPSASRASPRQPTPTTNSPKSDMIPTRVSSRRSRKTVALPLSPSNNTNHSSNSSSADVQPAAPLASTNSPSMNLVLTRHQQQWTTTATNNQR